MIERNVPPRIAVVGASSLVGEAIIDELGKRRLPHAALYALDDERSLGRPLAVPADDADDVDASDTAAAPGTAGRGRGKRLESLPVAAFDFAAVDLVFFCGRAALAERFAEPAAQHAWVIDCSATFRGRADVPLVVADVNDDAVPASGGGTHGLIALPGSASVALATALAPLHALAGVVRAEVATYHAVSGGGRGAMDELAGETVAMLSGKRPRGRAFGRQIAFNVIPQVDVIEADGISREERRLWQETRRVLGVPGLAINATAVRVPVFFGHAMSVHASFARPVTLAAAVAALRAARGIAVLEADAGDLPTPATLATAPGTVYVGRLRLDATRDQALNFWIVGDNVRKCAAHNAVSVARILVNSAR